MDKYYCTNGHELPTENNIITKSMHILNKCYICSCELWDKKGKFLGKIVKT